jgi:A/G-specific adenine glycosylase
VTAAWRRALGAALLKWYRATARDLPWRRTRDPYLIWLSEVMLQQTQVRTVVPYFERFVAALPTVEALATAAADTVMKLWEGLGYYARARHLYAAAQDIVTERGGRWPRTAAEWQELPGVGRYTAAAIASIAHGERVAVVDGNVQRVLARLHRVKTPIDGAATAARLWQWADELLAPAAPGDFNQALMELGARVCTPRRPRCAECPVARWCAALTAGDAARLPVKARRTPARAVFAAAAWVERRGRLLLVRRPARGLLGGLWELPTTMPAETSDEAALRAALAARLRDLGIESTVGGHRATIEHGFTHRRLTLHLFDCTATGRAAPRAPRTARQSATPEGPGHPRAGAAVPNSAWVARTDLGQYALGRMYRRLLQVINPADA